MGIKLAAYLHRYIEKPVIDDLARPEGTLVQNVHNFWIRDDLKIISRYLFQG